MSEPFAEHDEIRLKRVHDETLSVTFRLIHEGTTSMDEVYMLTLQLAQSLIDGVRLRYKTNLLARHLTPHDPSHKSPAPDATP